MKENRSVSKRKLNPVMQPIEAIFLLTNNINIIKINTSFSDKHKNKTVNNGAKKREKELIKSLSQTKNINL